MASQPTRPEGYDDNGPEKEDQGEQPKSTKKKKIDKPSEKDRIASGEKSPNSGSPYVVINPDIDPTRPDDLGGGISERYEAGEYRITGATSNISLGLLARRSDQLGRAAKAELERRARTKGTPIKQAASELVGHLVSGTKPKAPDDFRRGIKKASGITVKRAVAKAATTVQARAAQARENYAKLKQHQYKKIRRDLRAALDSTLNTYGGDVHGGVVGSDRVYWALETSKPTFFGKLTPDNRHAFLSRHVGKLVGEYQNAISGAAKAKIVSNGLKRLNHDIRTSGALTLKKQVHEFRVRNLLMNHVEGQAGSDKALFHYFDEYYNANTKPATKFKDTYRANVGTAINEVLNDGTIDRSVIGNHSKQSLLPYSKGIISRIEDKIRQVKQRHSQVDSVFHVISSINLSNGVTVTDSNRDKVEADREEVRSHLLAAALRPGGLGGPHPLELAPGGKEAARPHLDALMAHVGKLHKGAIVPNKQMFDQISKTIDSLGSIDLYKTEKDHEIVTRATNPTIPPKEADVSLLSRVKQSIGGINSFFNNGPPRLNADLVAPAIQPKPAPPTTNPLKRFF